MTRRPRAAVIAGGVVLGVIASLAIVAPTAQAAIDITVAPSSNGLVMKGAPTTITATGFTGRAKAFMYDIRSGSWDYLGTLTRGTPLSHTFTTNGRTKVKVVPKGKAARTVAVPVHARFVEKTDPWTFGDVQLPVGRQTSEFDEPVAMPASAGCSRVDVGLELRSSTGQSTSGTLLVQSAGAPEARLSVTDGAAVLLGVAVKGDVMVSIVDYVNPDSSASKAGVVWYCVGNPRLPEVPA